MNKKDIPAALAVFAVAGGLITLSAFAVPHISASKEVAQHVPRTYVSSQQTNPSVMLASSKAPVLNVDSSVPVSTVKQYLEQTMTDEEIQNIYHLIDNITQGNETGNRNMTAEENKRLKVLKEQYTYDGLRPEKPLPLKEGKYEFYLDMEKGSFVYPKRALTNEELLQRIDWSARVNYASLKRVVQPQPDSKDIKDADAIVKAVESVSKLFDVDLSKLDVMTSYNKMGPDQKGIWFVHFQPYKAEVLQENGKTYFMYDVYIDSLSGTVVDTTIFHSTYKRTPITAEAHKKISQDKSWFAAAKSVITEKQGEKRAIAGMSLISDDIYDKRGVVAVSIKLEDGSSYIAELRYPEQTLRCLIYEPAKKAKDKDSL
ncbi:hypothetical protein EBB07_12915 [Paenibacillaceae bacterium]|nr:hypothetical protein EBB07_12915 [Paenibacillaceae bacterium]